MARLVRLGCCLLLFCIVGCRSERVALRFRPTPATESAATPNHVTNDIPIISPATTVLSHPLVATRLRHHSRKKAILLPQTSRHKSVRRRHSVQVTPAKLVRQRSASGQAFRQALRPQQHPAIEGFDIVMGLIIACLLGGAGCLLVSLALLSGPLALVGLGLILLSFFIYAIAWSSGGSWY